MLMEDRERLEAGVGRDLRERGVAGGEEAARRLDPRPQEQVGRRRVEMLAEELEAPRRAESRPAHDGPGVG
jgi:hypothetical protein